MTEENTQNMDQTTALYLGVAILFSLFMAVAFSEIRIGGTVHQLGFFSRIAIFFLGIPGGLFGLKIGRWVRDVTMPDAFFYSGGVMEIAKTKLFWAFVPQAIGLLVGFSVAICPVIWLAT